MRILITGATGFIGTHLTACAAQAGHHVQAFSRAGRAVPGATDAHAWSLGDAVPQSLQDVPEVVVHLAHDFEGDTGAEQTRTGTKALMDALRTRGTRRQLLISSYSAGAHAKSRYGRIKAVMETDMAQDADVICVRPGLVLGDSGIYARMSGLVRRFPVVPLPDGGHGRVPVIEIDRLCMELLALCTAQTPPKEANLFHAHRPSLRELMQQTAADFGRNPVFVSVPVALVLPILVGLEKLGLKAPISSDNLVGFVQNQNAPHVSTLED